MSKSDVMREMYESGMLINEISKELGCHYSYVYGVIQRYCNKKGEEVKHVTKQSKSDVIRELFDQGNTVGSIAKQLNSNYSFVFSVVKKYKESKEQQ